MNEILKSAYVAKQTMTSDELAMINRQSLRELTAEEVFVFRLVACDNQQDRDNERFTDAALEGLAPKFVGRPVLMDHQWSAGCQTARVYGSLVESDGAIRRLVLLCYMPRTEKTEDTITAIESGILRECSVGCSVKRVICSICGADQAVHYCDHIPGREYNGRTCIMELDGAEDAYEVSLVAVPAQPAAGIIKSKRYGGQAGGPQDPPDVPGEDADLLLAMAMQAQEEKRYGGI